MLRHVSRAIVTVHTSRIESIPFFFVNNLISLELHPVSTRKRLPERFVKSKYPSVIQRKVLKREVYDLLQLNINIPSAAMDPISITATYLPIIYSLLLILIATIIAAYYYVETSRAVRLIKKLPGMKKIPLCSARDVKILPMYLTNAVFNEFSIQKHRKIYPVYRALRIPCRNINQDFLLLETYRGIKPKEQHL